MRLKLPFILYLSVAAVVKLQHPWTAIERCGSHQPPAQCTVRVLCVNQLPHCALSDGMRPRRDHDRRDSSSTLRRPAESSVNTHLAHGLTDMIPAPETMTADVNSGLAMLTPEVRRYLLSAWDIGG